MSHKVSAILLAAGSSKRMGLLKQLLPLNGKPIIRHSLELLLLSGIKDTIVVLGTGHERVWENIHDFPVKIVFNIDPGSDMAESVRTGLDAVDAHSTGILISLADHPLVSVETFSLLVGLHHEEPQKILIPMHGTKSGHPVLFPRNMLEDIFNGITLRDIRNKYSQKISFTEVNDEGVIIDIDTMEDYALIVNRPVISHPESSSVP